MRKINSQVLTVTRSLKRNGYFAPDLLHQLFPAYLACPDVVFHAYITLKQNSFEEGIVYKADYLMRCVSYKYRTLKEREEWKAPSSQQEQIIALRAEINTLNTTNSSKKSKSPRFQPTSTGSSTKKKPAIRGNCQEYMVKPPPKSSSKTRQVGKKTYN